jgi:ribonuclease PH
MQSTTNKSSTTQQQQQQTNLREDGRNFYDIRNIQIQFADVLETRADGCCLVSIGNNNNTTQVETTLFGPIEPANRDIINSSMTVTMGNSILNANNIGREIVLGELAKLDVSVRSTHSIIMSPTEFDLANTVRKLFEPIILYHLFPGTLISITCRILSNNGNLISALVLSVAGALIQAQIPLTCIPIATELIITKHHDHKIWIDPTQKEICNDMKSRISFGFNYFDSHSNNNNNTATNNNNIPTFISTQGICNTDEFMETAQVAYQTCHKIWNIFIEQIKLNIMKNKDLTDDF